MTYLRKILCAALATFMILTGTACDVLLADPNQPIETEEETAEELTATHIHIETVLEAVAPTCTETGLTDGVKCAECSKILAAQEVVPATGHTQGNRTETTAPTATEEGCVEYFCSVCGDVTYREAIVPVNFEIKCDNRHRIGYTGVDGEELVIPAVLQDGGTWYRVMNIGDDAFSGCSGLTSVVIPDSVTSIGYSAFWGCTGLTSIVIPDSVTRIGEIAFSSCSGLTSIVISNSVTRIDNDAFYGCSGLTSIVIPDSVTSIGAYAFSGCSGLTSIVIPDSVTSIAGPVFYDCSSLVEIAVEEGNPVYHSDGSCLIETESKILVAGCQTSVIPTDGSVTHIDNDAFYGCPGLTSIVIPDSVTSIGTYAFSGCSGLTSIAIPDGVTSIGEATFSGCSELTSIVIPDNVTSIGNFAFSDCSGLTSVVIPTSVTSIGGLAFSQCRDLSDIYFTGTESEWNAISKGSAWNDGTGSYTVHFNYIP